MVKDPLKDLVIAISGDFGDGKSVENFKRWIASGGGKFTSTPTEETTHLICTESDWKKKKPYGNVTLSVVENHSPPMLTQFFPVKEAIKMDTIKIVSFDWLEDSLRLRKCLKEKKYLMEALHTRKSRQQKEGLSCNSKVTKSGRPSKGELVSLFISHLNENQGSRGAGRGGSRDTGATKRASSSAGVKGKGKAKGIGKEKNQGQSVVTTTCSSKAVDLLEAHLRAQKEKLFAPENNNDTQPFSGPTLLVERAGDEADTSAAAPCLNSSEANAESADDQPMLIDSSDPPMFDLLQASHPSTAIELANHEVSESHHSVDPSKTNTLPPPKKPPQENPSHDYWIPVDRSKYHIYKDGSGFEYNVTLVRIDIRRNSNERFVLRLYESHTSELAAQTGNDIEIVAEAETGAEADDGHGANTYAVWLRFVNKKNSDEPVIQCLAAEGSEFETAMDVFRHAFRTWTGRRWEDRDKNVKNGGGDEAEGSELDAQMEEHSVNWEDGWATAVGLPSREEAKSKPFVYAKPRVYPRLKRAYGLGGMPIVAKYAAGV